MKTILNTILLGLLVLSASMAQTRTDETTKTVTRVKGDTTITEAVTISDERDITPRKQMIVINPLKFFLFYNITYFHQIAPNLALGGGIQSPTIGDLDGFGINAEIRFYPGARTLRGFYIAPNLGYNQLSAEGVKTEPLSVGVLIGWQWFPGDEFAIGLGIGVDYYHGTITEDDGDLENYHGKVPVLRFDIGYAW